MSEKKINWDKVGVSGDTNKGPRSEAIDDTVTGPRASSWPPGGNKINLAGANSGTEKHPNDAKVKTGKRLPQGRLR